MERLSRDSIVRALEAVARAVPANVARLELLVVGGAALVLLYGARETTKDVDAVVIGAGDAASLKAAARSIAVDLGLPEDWLNDGAKGYLHGVSDGPILLETPTLLVRAPAAEQLLAMKLCAWRDDLDIEDARLILSKLEGDRSSVWSRIEPYLVPGRELKAGYAFDDLWRRIVDLRDLVRSLLARDALSARQWVADARRGGMRWAGLTEPVGLDETALAVAAGVVELLAERAGQKAPPWASGIGPAPEPVYLVSAALRMPRLLRSCLEDGPEPLRRRRILAPPDFLTAA